MSNGDPQSGCDAACVKIIIDGLIMEARSEFLIKILHIQERFASTLTKLANKKEREELLKNSVKQCDFSKLIEASANETSYLMSEIASRAAGIEDNDRTHDHGVNHGDDR